MAARDKIQPQQFGPHMSAIMKPADGGGMSSWVSSGIAIDAEAAAPGLSHNSPGEDRWAQDRLMKSSIQARLIETKRARWGGDIVHVSREQRNDIGDAHLEWSASARQSAERKEAVLRAAGSGASAYDEHGNFGSMGTWGDYTTGRKT